MGTSKTQLGLAVFFLAAAPLAAQTADNSTFVYHGQIMVPDSTPAGTVTDDNALVRIEGSSVDWSGGWGNTGNTGNIQLNSGWHDVEFRFDNTSAVGGGAMNLFNTNSPAAYGGTMLVASNVSGSSTGGGAGGHPNLELNPGWHDVQVGFYESGALASGTINLFTGTIGSAVANPQAEAQVPEPTLIGLAGLSAIALIRRNRRGF